MHDSIDDYLKNKARYGPEHEPVPAHAHTCRECVRFTEEWRKPGAYRCSSVYGPDELTADRKACLHYWDRVEQEAAEQHEAEERERERQAAWEKNRDNPPRPAEWKRDWDEAACGLTGEMPFCPNCHEPLYEPERCFFCGQAILRDEKLTEYEKPPEVETMDCLCCGGKGTVEFVRSKVNGHKHGGCTQCGMRFIE